MDFALVLEANLLKSRGEDDAVMRAQWRLLAAVFDGQSVRKVEPQGWPPLEGDGSGPVLVSVVGRLPAAACRGGALASMNKYLA